MPSPFHISLGGVSISLVADDSPGEYDIPQVLWKFQDSPDPDICLLVHRDRFPDLQQARLLFDTSISWQWLQSDDQRIIKAISTRQNPYLLGVFPPDFRSGDLYTQESLQSPGKLIFPFGHPMGQLFMANLLGCGLGLIFHATGVLYQGEAYLFAGYGEAGKSTTARLWQEFAPGAIVVNDDKTIVRKENDGYRLYGTPWPGMGGMALPDSAPLKRVFIIEHSPTNHFVDLKSVQATSELLARAVVPLWDVNKMLFTLDFLESFTQDISCQKLGFVPDQSVIEFVLNL